MKKIIYTALVILLYKPGYAQYTPNFNPSSTHKKKIFIVTKVLGDEEIIKNAGEIAAYVLFDSIGKNWNMPTENDYLRFKILHFYTLNDRKNGEHWKKLYRLEKAALNNKFDEYLKGRLKRKNFKISTEFINTTYILKVYFIDSSTDIQYHAPHAVYQFIDTRSNSIVLQYHIEPKKEKALLEYIDTSVDLTKEKTTFLDLSIGMSNYFKKHIKY